MPRATRRSATPDADAPSTAVAVRSPAAKRAKRGADGGEKDDDVIGGGAIALRKTKTARGAPSRTSSLPAPIMKLTGHRASVHSVSFSHGGDVLASAGGDKVIELWRATSDASTSDAASSSSFGDNYAELRGAKNAITRVTFTRDDENVVSADADGVIRVFDAAVGTQVKSYVGARGKCANDVACGAGDVIASASDDGRVMLWDLRVAKRASRSFACDVPTTAVAMSKDGGRVFSGGVDDVVRMWDARMDAEAVLTMRGHSDTITGLALSPCGAYVLSNAMDNTLKMWDTRAYVEGEREMKSFVGHAHNYEKGLLRCAFSSDGTRVAAGSADMCVYVWDVDKGKLAYKLPGHKGAVNDVAFHPVENPILASAGADGVIFLGELDR